MGMSSFWGNFHHCLHCVTSAEKNSVSVSLEWRHNEHDGVSNRRLDCLHNRLLRHRSKKTSKVRVTGLCEGNPPVTRGIPTQRASNAVNVCIWWRHHVKMRINKDPKRTRLLGSNPEIFRCHVQCIIDMWTAIMAISTLTHHESHNTLCTVLLRETCVLRSGLRSYRNILSHWGRVTHICVGKLYHHWFR